VAANIDGCDKVPIDYENSPEIAFNDYSTNDLAHSEEVAKNLVPASREKARFKQQTFSGKPLSDEQVIQANQLAGEFEDQDIVRRLFRR
jgi:hypothetical protein